MKNPNQDTLIKSVSQLTITFFRKIIEKAKEKLNAVRSSDLLGSDIHQHRLQADKAIINQINEPAIARVVIHDDNTNEEKEYFISRLYPIASIEGTLIASYRSPIGRLAELSPGDKEEIDLPNGTTIDATICEHTELNPSIVNGEMDSVDSVIRTNCITVTVPSLLKEMQHTERLKQDSAIAGKSIDALLNEEDNNKYRENKKRKIIEKIQLRDQPILDKYQGNIFRLPINSKVALLGAAGSGKTTTLIKRLGHKIDRSSLTSDEEYLIQNSSSIQHENSWIMFCPTKLLILYLKESFAREGVPAPDSCVMTWDDYRSTLSRNKFRLLNTAKHKSGFILKKENNYLYQSLSDTHQIDWFNDFNSWQISDFISRIISRKKFIDDNDEIQHLSFDISFSHAAQYNIEQLIQLMHSIKENIETKKVKNLINNKKEETAGFIKDIFNNHRMTERIDELKEFMKIHAKNDSREDARDIYKFFKGNIRTYARTIADNKTIDDKSRALKMIKNFNINIDQQQIKKIGDNVLIITTLQSLQNINGDYFSQMSARYRKFRTNKLYKEKWYSNHSSFASSDAEKAEIDLLLLTMLYSAKEMNKYEKLKNIDVIKIYQTLLKNQIMVDEFSDFSPLQLACMYQMSNASIDSFFVSGDFNQRLTLYGVNSLTSLKWAIPKIEKHDIVIGYRQSEYLNKFTSDIISSDNAIVHKLTLPENISHEGYAPAIALNLSNYSDIAKWLYKRIEEIENIAETFPSIAVFVNTENEIQPLVDNLNTFLQHINTNAIACHQGQVLGLDNDVRVFNIKYIKGLEFEAVFFIGIDELAANEPSLFNKYLYVGASRAATFLGITCKTENFPIMKLRDQFVTNWSN